ncbi:MAG: HNH endonuclease [Deltaproteobacteria bacterium]|nr:HNH endonuclease [Deltaproteobacteria bacterium]
MTQFINFNTIIGNGNLKNYLFSQAAKRGELELDEADRRWQNISDTLKTNEITTFVRHYWNSRNKLERRSSLFKAIKRNIVAADSAFTLLDNLEKNAVFYAAFSNPYDEQWDKEERKHLKVINLLEVSTCYPLMLSALQFLPRSEFKILLRELAAITFRYNVSGLNPNDAEQAFGKAAVSIAAKGVQTVKEAVLQLKGIYVSDDDFEQTFSTKAISTKREKDLIKYILVKIENQLSQTDNQFEDAASTIEHILPENPGSVWENNFKTDEQLDWIYRLGNYTLLEASVNHRLDNDKTFFDKLPSYKASKYKITSEHLMYEDWTHEAALHRQQKMAKWAKAIWKSGFLR